MKVLLTITWFHDPFIKRLIDEVEQSWPNLSLISTLSFDVVYLFDTPGTQKITSETKKAISKLHKSISIEIVKIDLDDPTDYSLILKGLRLSIKKIIEKYPDTIFSIAVASGTPQMHACWFLLASSGEISARILHVRPPRYVTKDHPLVSEVNLSSHVFPDVRFCRRDYTCSPGSDGIDIDSVKIQIGIVGDHVSIQHALDIGTMMAPSRSPVLIFGETGTGKELFAKYIHCVSDRSQESFIPVNCAAIPENLFESLLFGHKKGSFTGALTNQTGKFDEAHKGTLFLDEIGELPVTTQAKLLRVLQDGMVEPIGQLKPHKVDVRVIGATNRDLRKLVRQGKFREDLYYRLNVGEINIPPLRE